jgi:tyrosyl-tRNA synthetase
MTLSEELLWRGQIKDKTFDDIKWLDEPQTFYHGVDCSSDSLAIGNLAAMMMARRLRRHGWKTVLLVGGATSLIGDPGGKDAERALKPREEIQANVAAIKGQVEKLFAGLDFTLVDNYDWFKDIGYLEFLRDIGKHYSMTELVQRDYIAARIGREGGGISYAEFSYSLIQGYDYWHLYKTQGTVLQIGGSDQWGNMLSGAPLIRKKEGVEVHALSMPLVINKATGKKFGKSEEGAVWLDPAKTSAYKFYQFWLNIDDEAVEDYLKIYTDLEKEQMEGIMSEFNASRGVRLAQKTLAYEVTKIVHGQTPADKIKHISEVLFGGTSFADLSDEEVATLSEEIPTVEVTDLNLPTLLHQSGLASSLSEARRFIEGNGVYVNGQKATEITHEQFIRNHALLRRGKNSVALIKIK